METDVYFPTDIRLLFDSMRKIITLVAILCSYFGVAGWRQSHHNIKTVRKLFHAARNLKHSTSKDEKKRDERKSLIIEAHRKLIECAEIFLKKAGSTITVLCADFEVDMNKIEEIRRYMAHAERQINQIRRRVIAGEKIPHKEKVFSIFEEHTEWISKGKAGVPQELGVRVCVLEDQHGYILFHHVMEKQTDDKVTVHMVEQAKKRFPALESCSFDKGFYTPENRKNLGEILETVVLPKKGKLSAADKEIEHSEIFKELRRKHSAVESGINALENHALDRCPDHGIEGFRRYVALSVLARNLQKLGDLIQKKAVKREKRLKAA